MDNKYTINAAKIQQYNARLRQRLGFVSKNIDLLSLIEDSYGTNSIFFSDSIKRISLDKVRQL